MHAGVSPGQLLGTLKSRFPEDLAPLATELFESSKASPHGGPTLPGGGDVRP